MYEVVESGMLQNGLSRWNRWRSRDLALATTNAKCVICSGGLAAIRAGDHGTCATFVLGNRFEGTLAAKKGGVRRLVANHGTDSPTRFLEKLIPGREIGSEG